MKKRIFTSMRLSPMLLLLALLVNSCSQKTTSNSSSGQSSTNPVVETTAPTLNTTGPTGESDTVNPDDLTPEEEGVTYYDDDDPEEEPTHPGVAYNACGTLYRAFNNNTLFFQNESNEILQMQEFSYDSVPYLRNITFTNDAFQVCFEGYRENSFYYLNTVTSSTAITHPLKTKKANYTHEICGKMAYITNYSGVTTLNLRIGHVDYLIKNPGNRSFPNVVPTTTTTITSTNSIEACLYSNKASYKDYSQTFKPIFEMADYDFGALN